jgi:hypothetical protein
VTLVPGAVMASADEQALLGRGEVATVSPAAGIVLGHLVLGPDVGPCRVDPQAEQAAPGRSLLSCADVGVRGGGVAVLEDLDADHQGPRRTGRQGAEVAADKAVTATRSAAGQLRDRGRGDIQAGQVQPATNGR